MDINETIKKEAGGDLSSKYVTFRVANQYYGVCISNVIEIVQIQPATELPELPAYSKGIINLRGRVIPLIDVNMRFGKAEREYTERTCIIIVDINDTYVGMIVDAVEDVRSIENERMSPPPTFSSDAAARYITAIGKMPEYMVLIMDCKLMFSEMDMGRMKQATV